MPEELDLSGEGGEDAKDEKAGKATGRRGGGRPTRPASEADLRKRIEDGLGEVVEFVDKKLEWPEIAATIREDSDRMAEVLAARATKHQRLAKLLARVFGKNSALAIARAFGPTLRSTGQHFRTWRDSRASEAEYTEEPPSSEQQQPLA